MKKCMIIALFALAAGTVLAAGQGNHQLPPGANPPGQGYGCLDNPGIGCGPRPSHPAPHPTPHHPPAPAPATSTSSSTSNAAAEAAAQATATANQNASQHIDGSAGGNRLTTGDSSASSSGGNSGASATGNGGGNITTNSEVTTYEAAKLPPQLPAVFLTMSAPCMGSAGGGAGSGVTVFNLSFTYSDNECKDIRRVMTLAGGFWSMNMRYSAFTVLCSFQKFKEVIPTCAQPFPADDPKQLWGYNPVDAMSEKARAEKAETELATLRNVPNTQMLSGITKDDLNDLKAALAASATVRVEVPTDKVAKKRVKCKMEEFTNSVGKKVTMCPGPSGSYEVTTVTREKAVGTTTGHPAVQQKTEVQK